MSPQWLTPRVRHWDRGLPETADQPRLWWAKQRPTPWDSSWTKGVTLAPRTALGLGSLPPLARATERLGALLESEGWLQEGAARRPPSPQALLPGGWAGLSTCRRGGRPGPGPGTAERHEVWSRRRLSAVCSGGGPARTVRAPDRWLTPKSASGAGAPLPQGTGPAGCRPPGRGPSQRRRGRSRALGPGARPRPPRPGVRAREGPRSVLPALDPVPDGPLLPRAPLHDQPQPEARVLGQLHLQAPAGVPAHDGAALWGREMGSAPGPSQGHPGIEGCSPMWSLMAACDSGPRLSPIPPIDPAPRATRQPSVCPRGSAFEPSSPHRA